MSETDIASAFVHQAREFLKNDYLPKIKRCLESLTDEQVWWRANAESNSIGNLLLHLSGNARQWIVSGLGGEADHRERQSEFDERSLIPRKDLFDRLHQTLDDVDRVLAAFDSKCLLEEHQIQSTEVTALGAIFHVIEHFSMHTGQIIMITKMLTRSDLRFYEFDDDVPVTRWKAGQA